jgi:hypothetical protein
LKYRPAEGQPTNQPQEIRMKIDTESQDVVVHGDFKTSEFAIGDISFIVDMFADKVYSHKERAVIRELSCNAHDSHILAGTTDVSFNVHLPTQLEPNFTIRDYGTGLTDDEVRNIFAGIGISTKRDSNEVIGCFGIGSLSPYSLTDSFTVKSYKDGVCRTYTCYRDKERKPIVALLTELETDEANGLEVSLTVEDRVWEFEKEAINVFKFWEGTLPNINNDSVVEQCKEQREKYVFQGDDFGLTPSWGSMKAIMGNISYAIPDELDEFNTNGYLKFKLGELNFDTARENLTMDDKTKSAIKAKFNTVKDKLATEASQQIKDEPSLFKQATLSNKLQAGSLGKFIKADLSKYELPKTSEEFTYFARNWRSTDKSTSTRVPVGENIEYYTHKDRMQTRIRDYIKNSDKLTMVILSEEQIKECKIDLDILLDLDDLPKVQNTSYTRTGSTVKTFVFNPDARRYTVSDYWDETELTIDGSEIVYAEICRWEPVNGDIIGGVHELKSNLERLKKAGLEVPTVVVGLKTAFTKTKQFKNGNFVRIDDYIKRELISNAPSVCYEFNRDTFKSITILNNLIDCEEVTELVGLVSAENKSEITQWLNRLNIETEMEMDSSLQDSMEEFYQKYFMLTVLSDWDVRVNKETIAKYINGTVKGEQTDE